MNPSMPRPRVGVYLHNSGASIERYVRCLKEWQLDFRSVWRDDLPRLGELGIDVLLIHGGWYGIDRQPGQDQHTFESTPEQRAHGDAIRKFVREGGGAVGICAGAYNVVWLGLIEAEISRADGIGMHSLEVTDGEHPLLRGVAERAEGRTDRAWKPIPTIRWNGPIFMDCDPRHRVAAYDWEQRLGAVLAADYGAGRAVAISGHPEMVEEDLTMEGGIATAPRMPCSLILRNALYWAAGRDGDK